MCLFGHIYQLNIWEKYTVLSSPRFNDINIFFVGGKCVNFFFGFSEYLHMYQKMGL